MFLSLSLFLCLSHSPLPLSLKSMKISSGEDFKIPIRDVGKVLRKYCVAQLKGESFEKKVLSSSIKSHRLTWILEEASAHVAGEDTI